MVELDDADAVPSSRGRATLYDFWLRFREKPWARRSLLIFPRGHLLRKMCIALTQSVYFLYFVQLLIVSNCISSIPNPNLVLDRNIVSSYCS